MNVLIVYASIEGQAARIAKFVENRLSAAGHTVTRANALESDAISFKGIDKVILAASVHERRHPRLFEALLTASKAQLAARDVLLLSVSLSAAFPEGLEEAAEYVTELKMRTGLQSDADVLVAGAIRNRQYDYFATQVLRHVVMRDRDYDPSVQENEFTNWDAVSQAVDEFIAREKVSG